MKKNNLLQIAVTTLLMANSFVATAGTQYPAADFEPKVVYQDASVKSSAPATAAVSVKSEAAAPAPVADAYDAKYPATNFEPKVIFSDASYKHTKSAPGVATHAVSAVSESVAVASVEKKDDSNMLVLGLVAAAAAAFFAFSKSPKSSASTHSHDHGTRETGVTRYLNARMPKVSGVSKYLERNTAPTNVARYIARQNIAHKASAQHDTDRG